MPRRATGIGPRSRLGLGVDPRVLGRRGNDRAIDPDSFLPDCDLDTAQTLSKKTGVGAHHRALRPGGQQRQGRRPRRRRRRLRHQTVRRRRAPRPHPRSHPTDRWAGQHRGHRDDRPVANPDRRPDGLQHRRHRAGTAHPDRMEAAGDLGPKPRKAGQPAPNCCRKCGDRSTAARQIISASTWRSCVTSWRTTFPTRVTCSPNPVWATDYT